MSSTVHLAYNSYSRQSESSVIEAKVFKALLYQLFHSGQVQDSFHSGERKFKRLGQETLTDQLYTKKAVLIGNANFRLLHLPYWLLFRNLT